MKTLHTALRTALIVALAGLVATPADAARSNLFGRSSRSMMGVSDGGTGEVFTVTPGSRSLRSRLRSVGGIGYGSGAGGFNMAFARNGRPRSLRGTNGSRMSFSGVRGGGMRALLRNLSGARVGQPMTIFPGSGSLAERGGTAPTSFNFTAFKQFGFTREQILNDTPLFGSALARLVDTGLGSVNLLLQRLTVAFADPLNEIPVDPALISALLTTAAGQAISGFDGSGNPQEISDNPFDFVEYLRGLLELLPSDLAAQIERLLTRDVISALAMQSSLLAQALTQLNDPSINPPDYTPIDPGLPGTVEFTDDRTAVAENTGGSFVYLTRDGGSFGEAIATVTLDSGSMAVPGHDFRFRTQTIKWKDGEAGPKAVAYSTINDNSEDGDIDFNLNLDSVTGASSGSVLAATVVIVDDDGAGGVAVARNPVLVCEYTWPRSKRDLDTGTTFLGDTVGYNLNPSSQYMLWTGDDTTDGGREIVVVDIDSAVENGESLSTFDIDCVADWFGPAEGFGPATLSVYFREKFTAKVFPKVSIAIEPTPLTEGGAYAHPGGGTNASTPVADVTVTFDSDAGFFKFDIANPTSAIPPQ